MLVGGHTCQMFVQASVLYLHMSENAFRQALKPWFGVSCLAGIHEINANASAPLSVPRTCSFVKLGGNVNSASFPCSWNVDKEVSQHEACLE